MGKSYASTLAFNFGGESRIQGVPQSSGSISLHSVITPGRKQDEGVSKEAAQQADSRTCWKHASRSDSQDRTEKQRVPSREAGALTEAKKF